MRRLPVYMLIDCSGSMNGDAIEAVGQGFKNLTTMLNNDPTTCDVVWFSIIIFDSTVRQLFPLCPIGDYKELPLKVGGSSNLGRALQFLSDCVKKEVRKQTSEKKGDWKPLVFLMSDGKPSDDWEKICKTAESEINLIACGVGADADIENLKKITGRVVLMKDMTQETLDQFIDFVRSLTTMASQRSENQSDTVYLEKKKYSKIVLS
ncbi:MAG: hypothetical protein BWK80_06635 [Desulfobacteraceae bacterium IS3]|nr:MAG: hypothetical protein BWK80_06635 [Desulfobacteraceae bacterium IS3]